jgi:hypothetical protein
MESAFATASFPAKIWPIQRIFAPNRAKKRRKIAMAEQQNCCASMRYGIHRGRKEARQFAS